MRWLETLRMQIRMLFRRGRESQCLDAELRYHLDRQIAENIAAGMPADEARRAALRTFGNPVLLREQTRATWSWNGLESIVRDLRYAVRTLRRTPGFTASAILVMALGIGANVSLFTVVHSVLLNPLPFPNPKQLVVLYGQDGPKTDTGNVVAAGDFYDWLQGTHGFEQMAIWRWTGYNMAGDRNELPEFLDAVTCSWNFFATLSVEPAIGRSFTEGDDRREASPTVVLAWSFFERRFNGNAAIVGKTIRLNGQQYTVIGVMPRWFNYPDPKIQVWIPYHIGVSPRDIRSHYNHTSEVIGRLKPGVSRERATQEASAIEHGIYLRFIGNGPVAPGVVSRPLIDDVVGDAKTPLYVLMAAVSCLLLIACLNLSNLLVARGVARRKEMAIRSALGGSSIRLVRQQLAESLLICLSGAALGLLFAVAAVRWFTTYWVDLPRSGSVHIDGSITAFAIAIALLAGTLSGLLPAMSVMGGNLSSALQDGAKTIGANASRALMRKALLSAELALTVVLLIGAGLLFKSFLHLRSVNVGCATKNVLTMRFFLRGDSYSKPEQIVSLHTQLLERVRHLPGVTAAGLTNGVPGAGYYGDSEIWIPEHPPQPSGEHHFARYRTADPGYFQALQIPLLEGRFFASSERLSNDKYVIINQQLAHTFFPNEDPVGKHLRVQWSSKVAEDFEIVGVVGNTRHLIDQPFLPMMWFPILSGNSRTLDTTLVVRSDRNVNALAIPVQKAIASLDPDLPVSGILTMEQIIGDSTANSSFDTTLLVAFAVLSLLLAAVGLFGVLSYLVAQRTGEIGIRMALGAQRDQVLRKVLLDGLRPTLVGLVFGLVASTVAVHLIRSMLYETQPLDPAVFATVTAILLLVAALACAAPAWRASRLDPMQALRTE